MKPGCKKGAAKEIVIISLEKQLILECGYGIAKTTTDNTGYELIT